MKTLMAVIGISFGLGLVSMNAQADLRENAPVTLVEVNGQTLLADRQQLTAYTFDPDSTGASTCYDGCAKAWPPILVQNGEVVKAPFTKTARRDGTSQLAYSGRPLYLYAGDAAAGDITGDGIGGVWHIVPVESVEK